MAPGEGFQERPTRKGGFKGGRRGGFREADGVVPRETDGVVSRDADGVVPNDLIVFYEILSHLRRFVFHTMFSCPYLLLSRPQ